MPAVVESLTQIGRLEMFVVRSREAAEGEGLVDVRLDPGTQFRMFILPAGEPRGQIAAGLLRVVAVIDP
jgi:hypothetical protein